MNFTIPNLLSILRMGLIPWFAISVIEGDATQALWIFAIAGVTDALDGFIARFWHQQSALGAYLDPLADKLLLVTAYVMLAIPNLRIGLVIPAWVTALVITRDVVIVVVALVLHLAVGISRFPPSPPTCAFFVYLVAALTIGSGIEYIYRANRMAAHRE